MSHANVGLDLSPLDEYDMKIAEEELREVPENVEKGLAELRRLLKEDTNIHFEDSDEFLLIHLRRTKFYPESALGLLRRIADFRKRNADALKNLSPTSEKNAFLNTKVINVLVDRDQKRRRIMTMNIGKEWNPRQLDTEGFFRVLYLIHYAAIMEPRTQIHGSVIIMDFTDLGMRQAMAFTPAFSFRLLDFVQDANPNRLKAIHIVFQPFVFNIVWKIFKPFIHDKLSKRIFIHGKDVSSLHQHISPDCLPAVYGGTKGELDYSSKDWYPVLAGYEEKIKVWHSYGFVKKEK